MPRPLRPALLSLLLAGAALFAACDGDSNAAPAGEGPVPTAEAGTTATTPSGASPTPTATATAPPVEPTASTGAIPTDQLPVIEFVREGGTSVELPVEVVPRDEFGVGLSGRYSLEGRGMLFYYPEPGSRNGFWMQNTHIDLSIAFANAEGVIEAIAEMEAESTETVKPVDGYTYAVEAPAGWYAEHDIEAGDRLELRFDIADWYPD